jgi:hypothetical protein
MRQNTSTPVAGYMAPVELCLSIVNSRLDLNRSSPMSIQNTLGECNVPLVSARPPTASHDPIRSSPPPTLQDETQLPCGQLPSSPSVVAPSATPSHLINPTGVTVPAKALFVLPSVLPAPIGDMGASLRTSIVVPTRAPLGLKDLLYLKPIVAPSPTDASVAPSGEPAPPRYISWCPYRHLSWCPRP